MSGFFSSIIGKLSRQAEKTPRTRKRDRQAAGTSGQVTDFGAVFALSSLALDDMIVPVSPLLLDTIHPDDVYVYYHKRSDGRGLCSSTFPIWSLCSPETRAVMSRDYGFQFEEVQAPKSNYFGLETIIVPIPPSGNSDLEDGLDHDDVVYFARLAVSPIVRDDPIVVIRDNRLFALFNTTTDRMSATATLYRLSRKEVAQALRSARGNAIDINSSSEFKNASVFDWKMFAEPLISNIQLHQFNMAHKKQKKPSSWVAHSVAPNRAADLPMECFFVWTDVSTSTANQFGREYAVRIGLKHAVDEPKVIITPHAWNTGNGLPSSGPSTDETALSCKIGTVDDICDRWLTLGTGDLAFRYLLGIPESAADEAVTGGFNNISDQQQRCGAASDAVTSQYPWKTTAAATVTVSLLFPEDRNLLVDVVMPSMARRFEQFQQKARGDAECSVSRSLAPAAVSALVAAANEAAAVATTACDLNVSRVCLDSHLLACEDEAGNGCGEERNAAVKDWLAQQQGVPAGEQLAAGGVFEVPVVPAVPDQPHSRGSSRTAHDKSGAVHETTCRVGTGASSLDATAVCLAASSPLQEAVACFAAPGRGEASQQHDATGTSHPALLGLVAEEEGRSGGDEFLGDPAEGYGQIFLQGSQPTLPPPTEPPSRPLTHPDPPPHSADPTPSPPSPISVQYASSESIEPRPPRPTRTLSWSPFGDSLHLLQCPTVHLEAARKGQQEEGKDELEAAVDSRIRCESDCSVARRPAPLAAASPAALHGHAARDTVSESSASRPCTFAQYTESDHRPWKKSRVEQVSDSRRIGGPLAVKNKAIAITSQRPVLQITKSNATAAAPSVRCAPSTNVWRPDKEAATVAITGHRTSCARKQLPKPAAPVAHVRLNAETCVTAASMAAKASRCSKPTLDDILSDQNPHSLFSRPHQPQPLPRSSVPLCGNSTTAALLQSHASQCLSRQQSSSFDSRQSVNSNRKSACKDVQLPRSQRSCEALDVLFDLQEEELFRPQRADGRHGTNQKLRQWCGPPPVLSAAIPLPHVARAPQGSMHNAAHASEPVRDLLCDSGASAGTTPAHDGTFDSHIKKTRGSPRRAEFGPASSQQMAMLGVGRGRNKDTAAVVAPTSPLYPMALGGARGPDCVDGLSWGHALDCFIASDSHRAAPRGKGNVLQPARSNNTSSQALPVQPMTDNLQRVLCNNNDEGCHRGTAAKRPIEAPPAEAVREPPLPESRISEELLHSRAGPAAPLASPLPPPTPMVATAAFVADGEDHHPSRELLTSPHTEQVLGRLLLALVQAASKQRRPLVSDPLNALSPLTRLRPSGEIQAGVLHPLALAGNPSSSAEESGPPARVKAGSDSARQYNPLLAQAEQVAPAHLPTALSVDSLNMSNEGRGTVPHRLSLKFSPDSLSKEGRPTKGFIAAAGTCAQACALVAQKRDTNPHAPPCLLKPFEALPRPASEGTVLKRRKRVSFAEPPR